MEKTKVDIKGTEVSILKVSNGYWLELKNPFKERGSGGFLGVGGNSSNWQIRKVATDETLGEVVKELVSMLVPDDTLLREKEQLENFEVDEDLEDKPE